MNVLSKPKLAIPAALLTLAAVVPFANPASAHSELTGSNPEDGAVVSERLDAAELTFNERVQPEFSVVKVAGPDDVELQTTTPSVTDTVLTQPLPPIAQAGNYTLSYRVVSADGHPISGSIEFEYAGPLEVTTSTSPTEVATSIPADPSPATSNADGKSFLSQYGLPIAVAVAVIVLFLVIRGLRSKRER